MRFMHIADVHLGAQPDQGYPWSEERGREIRDSFHRCIAAAKEKKVDLLLISGDLFHRPPTIQELNEVNYLFSTLESTIVALIAGNHDFLAPNTPYLQYNWCENVITLFAPSCECVKIPELKTEIYGLSYYQQEIDRPLYQDIHPQHSEYFKILLAHGGDARHIPIDKANLRTCGFDYVALGHIHKPQQLIRNYAVYPGALEPIDCDDIGPHGYILGEVHRKKLNLKFIRSCTREYYREKIEVVPTDTAVQIREKIQERIEKQGRGNMYRIILSGYRNPDLNLDFNDFFRYGRIIDFTDQTRPSYDTQALLNQYRDQLVGNYIESFAGAQPGSMEEKALYYGLEALFGGVIE